MNLISTWTYPLPSCRYGMHASYLHMDIPTTIRYLWYACILSPHGQSHHHHVYGMHASYLHMDIPTTIMYLWFACILSLHGHTHYPHVCKKCVHLISTWTSPPPSRMYGIHAAYLHMDIPTIIMYVRHA